MLAPSATLVLSVRYGAEVRFQPRNTRNTPNESHFFSVYSAYSVVKKTISFRVLISLRRRDSDYPGLADTLDSRLDACQSRQGVVGKVGGCHRVRSTGALKTRNLSPLTQSIVGHGHPFWEHQVAVPFLLGTGLSPWRFPCQAGWSPGLA
jgi:hypothetical protein